MSGFDLVVRADRAIVGDDEVPVSVGVRDGVIAEIADAGELAGDRVVELAADEVLLPGLVDTHVHVNEPGRTEWEGFLSATRAAAAGGVTTILDMPLNSIPPTVDPDALALKRATASSRAVIDVGFWGGAIPGSLGHLGELDRLGVYGFKCFTLPSGVDEFPPLDGAQVRAAMAELAALDALLIVHAEDHGVIDGAAGAGGPAYRDFLASRPREAENRAIADVIEAARETGCRVHLLHLSSSEALAAIAAARADGVRLTVETCPHYLCLRAEEVPDGATEFKCCPPIREAANQDLLWDGLRSGVIDMVVSDHSPATADLKLPESGDFAVAWGGISSLQLGLSLLWTHGRPRGVELTDLVRWMATTPASVAGVGGKGSLAVGNAADFCVFAPEDRFTVEPGELHHRNPISPYAGQRLDGVVRSTWLAGVPVDLDADPRGRLLTKEHP